MNSSNFIRVLVVEPMKLPRQRVIPNSLKALQTLVGGYIEVIYPFTGDSAVLICNEEGKLLSLPLNRSVGDDIIAGPFVICGSDPENGEFISLTSTQVERYSRQFRIIEQYITLPESVSDRLNQRRSGQ